MEIDANSAARHKQAKKNAATHGNVTVFEDAHITKEIAYLLGNGPKYGLQTRIAPQELLSLNRSIVNNTEHENRDRCLLDGVDTLMQTAPKGTTRTDLTLSRVATYFKDNRLCLLQSDKEGGFVAMSSDMFFEKASNAVAKNMTLVKNKGEQGEGSGRLSL